MLSFSQGLLSKGHLTIRLGAGGGEGLRLRGAGEGKGQRLLAALIVLSGCGEGAVVVLNGWGGRCGGTGSMNGRHPSNN